MQQQQLMQLDQLLLDVAFVARQKFPKTPIRVWYVMLDDRAWKGILINTVSKIKLAEGPGTSNPDGFAFIIQGSTRKDCQTE